MVGYAFMGQAHSQGWRTVGRVFDLPLRPALAAVCGRDPAAVRTAAERLGWAAAETDWRALIARPDVQLVDICTPGDSHAEIAIAALAAGKHVLCEKPLANTVEEAEAMASAARARPGARPGRHGRLQLPPHPRAGARAPHGGGRQTGGAAARAGLLPPGLAGRPPPSRWPGGCAGRRRAPGPSATWGRTPSTSPSIWPAPRWPGSPRRPRRSSGSARCGRASRTESGARSPWTTPRSSHGRLGSGALASFEVTRVAAGRKNALRVELNGTLGSLAFDLERLNELEFHDHTQPAGEAGFRRILVTEQDHPYLEAWWPPGHGLGYEHTFTHQARDLVHAIATGTPPAPSFDDGLQVQRVLAAVEESAGRDCVYTPVQHEASAAGVAAATA